MEQATRGRPHFERALFICGGQNAGKSHLLREMFADPRFGTSRVIPTASRISPVSLSQDRSLFVRCTSPHEANETLARFMSKIDRSMAKAARTHWRFNFACAVQPQAANKMPDVVETCKRFKQEFQPERIRLVQIDPHYNGDVGATLTSGQIDALRRLFIEVCTVDARQIRSGASPNGFFLADFFDFS